LVQSSITPDLQGHRALWRLESQLPAEIRAELNGQSVMLSHLLYCRGLRSSAAIHDFFARRPVSHDPFLMSGMEPAVERIGRAVEAGERVAVYGDFDCDGITAAAVLLETLHGLGLQPVAHIPTREDGHGLHPEALAALSDSGIDLLVTADCGITAIEEVQVARGMGLDVIVTDHHEPRPDGSLPNCPVVAPTTLDSAYPFRTLCGAGVAYKLAQGLAARLPHAPDPDALLDLVALGTVADVVPMRDENRSLVMRGLEYLKRTSRPGLVALFEAAGVDPSRIDPTSIGFYLAPRINAANRMATPQLAYDLLTATDPEVAREVAQQLSRLNSDRQTLVAGKLTEVLSLFGEPAALASDVAEGRRAPVVVVDGDWPTGISGLLASKLAETYGLPAFVGALDPGGLMAVSARGIPGVRIDELLESCETALPGGLFVGYGGHSRAGGFRVAADRWKLTRSILEEQAQRQIQIDAVGAVLSIDAEVPLAHLTIGAAKQILSLAPFGMDFSEPLFLGRNVTLKRLSPVSGGRHARCRFMQSGRPMDGVFFNAPKEFMDLPLETPLDLVFHLQLNEWQGRLKPEIRLRDWRLSR
jgi:single-stranded-DNA-specific exonuclease